MPLIVNDYNWKQTENIIVLKVPLHGICSSKVDVFTSTRYLKASYPPNFFEVLLSHPVNISQSTCVITDSEIIFELQKNENEHWESLELNVSKIEKQKLKQELIAEEHERYQNECKAKTEKKTELKQTAVREAIKLDTKQRQNIDAIKTQEKNKALGDIAGWHNEKFDEETNKYKLKAKIKKNKSAKPIEDFIQKEKPQIRQNASLQVSFTPRALPTPSRESRLDEENEWLRKQAEARRSVGFASEDLRPEEKNPLYLKTKGDEFMKQNNYLGAISAYGFGIKLSEKYADLYIGRSEAHYRQGNYKKAIEDCSTALELMKPEVERNFNERAFCIARRGVCLSKIGLHEQALSELQLAFKMKPDNDDVRLALQMVEKELDNADSD